MRTDVVMIKQIEHLFFVQRLSKRAIAKSLGVTPKTVRKILKNKIAEHAAAAGDDEKPPNPAVTTAHPTNHWSTQIDWEKIHSEFLQGATLKILHKEFAPDNVSYWVFNREHNKRKPSSTTVTMRLNHNPGEKSFFDFADGI